MRSRILHLLERAMYSLAFEGLGANDKAVITSFVPDKLNAVVNAANDVGTSLIQRWFGSRACPGGLRYAEFDSKRKAMAEYLTRRCRRLIYVKKEVGKYVDKCEVERGDIAQVIRSSFSDSSAAGVPEFVPSGLRVFVLGDTLLSCPPRRQFHTMAHEITHRVIQTIDHWYGEQNCLDQATRNSQECLRCAANWGWFYVAVMETMPTAVIPSGKVASTRAKFGG